MIRILLCCFCVAGTGYALAHPWESLYGDEITFDVMRNNDRVGEYRTRFVGTAQGHEVEASLDINMRVFMFWDYEYRYRAREVWHGTQLQTLEARVDDNGEQQSVILNRDEGDLVGAGPGGDLRIDPAILPTHHYNASVISAQRVFNTLTGRVNEVELRPLGQQQLQVADQLIDTTHYRYRGDLSDTEVWYDHQGRWLKLRFPGSDGTPIEFVCRQCGYRTDS